ncbi:MAG: haloacid dehalogenase [Desulfobacterales bacterium]|nr:MAG: haloacid dehalogenase [Desulfobacterales bacterium]
MIDPASVAFDIDGVLADTMRLFIDIAREDFHINSIRYEDFTSYDLADCIDMDPEVINAIVTRILDGNYRAPLKPIAGASQVLKRLGRYHRPILFVTARPYVGPIRDWMQDVLKLGSDSIEVVATGSFEDKADVLLESQVTHFVEDRLETCFYLHDLGFSPILFKQPWNRKRHPFVEVSTWRELEALIKF